VADRPLNATVTRSVRVLYELGSFSPERGHCFSVELPGSSGDNVQDKRGSLSQLLEDGVLLGPSHADHRDIREIGQGRYSHWGEMLYFSTADNSDPRTNGRRYALWLPLGPVALRYQAPGSDGARRRSLFEIDNFLPHHGHSFSVELPGSSGDNVQDLRGSRLQLLEDGFQLGPPHAEHGEIETTGQGCYSHWGETLYFSASDNSDPRTNGRRYALWLPPDPLALRYQAPGSDGARRRSLFEIDNFLPHHGHSFSVELPGSSGDTAQDPHGSRLQLLEDGFQLGPPHAEHGEIETTGQGCYSHWGETLYFSASDNSDPRTNGCRYALWLPPDALALRYQAPGSDGARRRSLFEIDNFLPHHGHSFSVELPGSSGDTAQDPHGSLLQLLEDGFQLGPPHAEHGEIETTGQGCYSHWGETLYFSASDNSDPRTNGRRYHVQLGAVFGRTPAATRAIEAIRTLPADYSPAVAYTAVEGALAALDPLAVLGDTHKAYWQNDGFVRDFLRIVGKDRRTMERKYTVYQLMKSLYWLPGDIAECGTWHGGTAYFMALAGREVGKERPFHIFDSFRGLSSPTPLDGDFWREGHLAAPIDAVKSVLAGFSDIHIYPGWIPAEFHRVADRRFCLVHLDVDLHEPTRDSLKFFYPRMEPGGIIVCDDYGSALCPGARVAIDEYLEDKPERIIDLPTMQGLIIKRPL
jgi:O-methyltransferase